MMHIYRVHFRFDTSSSRVHGEVLRLYESVCVQIYTLPVITRPPIQPHLGHCVTVSYGYLGHCVSYGYLGHCVSYT